MIQLAIHLYHSQHSLDLAIAQDRDAAPEPDRLVQSMPDGDAPGLVKHPDQSPAPLISALLTFDCAARSERTECRTSGWQGRLSPWPAQRTALAGCPRRHSPGGPEKSAGRDHELEPVERCRKDPARCGTCSTPPRITTQYPLLVLFTASWLMICGEKPRNRCAYARDLARFKIIR